MADAESKPIWHSPIWITAIVSLISILFTVPEVIGNYLTKQQDIVLAKEKALSVALKNDELKQDQTFTIVHNTLAQQGTERVFLLRYLSAALDDEKIANWAKEEVKLLDELAKREALVISTEKAIAAKENSIKTASRRGSSDVGALVDELSKLKSTFETLDEELLSERQSVGIPISNKKSNFSRQASKLGDDVFVTKLIVANTNNDNHFASPISINSTGISYQQCYFFGGECDVRFDSRAPLNVRLESVEFNPESQSSFTLHALQIEFPSRTSTRYEYDCVAKLNAADCKRK